MHHKDSEQYLKMSVEELECLILQREDTINNQTKDETIEELLRVRARKLNAALQFNKKDKQKLLRLDSLLQECFVKMYEEANEILQRLDKRIKNEDSYLHDYEIEIKVVPFILVPGDDGELKDPSDGIYSLLGKYYWLHALSDSITSGRKKEDILYLNRSLNWNHTIYPIEKELSDCYISFSIHELYDHTLLSIHDILKINRLWGEVNVRHQHFIENFNKEE